MIFMAGTSFELVVPAILLVHGKIYKSAGGSAQYISLDCVLPVLWGYVAKS